MKKNSKKRTSRKPKFKMHLSIPSSSEVSKREREAKDVLEEEDHNLQGRFYLKTGNSSFDKTLSDMDLTERKNALSRSKGSREDIKIEGWLNGSTKKEVNLAPKMSLKLHKNSFKANPRP